MTEELRVLIAEDEPALLRHICQKIGQLGAPYRLLAAAENGAQALELAQREPPDLVVTDIRMPRMDGLNLIRVMQERGMVFGAVLMSGYDDFSYAREAIRLGVSEYLLKPVSVPALREALQRAAQSLEQRRLASERAVSWCAAEADCAADPTLSLSEKEQISVCLLAGRAGALHQLLKKILESRTRQGISRRMLEMLTVSLLDACFSLCGKPIEPTQRAQTVQYALLQIERTAGPEELSDVLFARVRPLLFEADSAVGGREGAALRIRNYLQEHYMEQVSLSSLAALAGMDPAGFTKAFRSCCGEAPMKYLISLRIEAAKKLLLEHPMLGIKTVGETVGYPDPFHFSKTFKKLTGLSPSEYRLKEADPEWKD